ncbi:hypothetical protein ACRAWF_24550, partial [Streptomyces sp. L7]
MFLMDLQGNGRSPRPKMDEPRNANPAQRDVLVPNPLPTTPATAVVCLLPLRQPGRTPPAECAQGRPPWSSTSGTCPAGTRRPSTSSAGPPRDPSWVPHLQHPDTVGSLFLLAPIFPPGAGGRATRRTPLALPSGTTLPVSNPPLLYGFPMHVATKTGFTQAWDREQG